MVATIHVLHITVMHISMLAVTCILTIKHIAGRSLQRLRCKQYKNGQKNVFHNTILHLLGMNQRFLKLFRMCNISLWQVFLEETDLVATHHRTYFLFIQTFVE